MAPGGKCIGKDRVKNAESGKYPQSVFPDVDAGTEDAQILVLLVNPHPPALACEGKTGRETGNAAAGDLDGAAHSTKLTGSARRQTA